MTDFKAFLIAFSIFCAALLIMVKVVTTLGPPGARQPADPTKPVAGDCWMQKNDGWVQIFCVDQDGKVRKQVGIKPQEDDIK